MLFRRSRPSVSLRGEITETPPFYEIFREERQARLGLLLGAWFMGAVLFPFLMAVGSTWVLYSIGAGMLLWVSSEIYERYKENNAHL